VPAEPFTGGHPLAKRQNLSGGKFCLFVEESSKDLGEDVDDKENYPYHHSCQ